MLSIVDLSFEIWAPEKPSSIIGNINTKTGNIHALGNGSYLEPLGWTVNNFYQ